MSEWISVNDKYTKPPPTDRNFLIQRNDGEFIVVHPNGPEVNWKDAVAWQPIEPYIEPSTEQEIKYSEQDLIDKLIYHKVVRDDTAARAIVIKLSHLIRVLIQESMLE